MQYKQAYKQFFTCTVQSSLSQIKDVRDHRKEDRMESFFLAETTKYLYLLFDTDNFIHNTGQQGTVIDTPNGECIIEAGGYIFNTEAHPIDPAALHCCHDVPKMNLFDFSDLSSKRSLFRGEILEKRSVPVRENDTGEESVAEVLTEPVVEVTNISMEEPKEASQSSEDEVQEENIAVKNFIERILPNHTKQFDPQDMLEKIRTKKIYPRNTTWEQNYRILSCKAQPFIQRISVLGEFFNT